ncbi:putative transcriptional regulatory protein PtsJ [Micromonospora noduli]|nr:putative transcriptional regulatory protein PtsJ [Micromonospora noduli]
MSKPFGPDLRMAVLVGDETTVARVSGRTRVGAGWVSTVLQRLVLALWRDPAVTELVQRAAQSYEQRREGLLAALAEHGLTAHGRSGINVWLPVADETSTVTALRDAGWAVAPGALYRIAAPPALRITVSSLDTADLVALAAALARAENPPPSQGFPT